MQYMKAVLLAHTKEVREDGSIVEVVIWELPDPLPPSAHRFKYRLFLAHPEANGYGTTTNVAKVTIGTVDVEKINTSSLLSFNCSMTSSATFRTGVPHEGNH